MYISESDTKINHNEEACFLYSVMAHLNENNMLFLVGNLSFECVRISVFHRWILYSHPFSWTIASSFYLCFYFYFIFFIKNKPKQYIKPRYE